MKSPRILFLDIETFPITAYVWGVYQQDVISIKEHSSICCYAAKWEGEKPIVRGLIDCKGYKAGSANDRQLVTELWHLLDDTDIVIAHNGDRFDIPKLRARFVRYNLLPPAPFKTVDTKKIASAVFGFSSNGLDALCQYLGIGKKAKTGGFDLWLDCMAGKKEAWAHMKEYNAHDIVLLEGLYDRLLPWINTHPNLAMYNREVIVCPKCGSAHLQARGVREGATRSYQRFQCQTCGGWSQSVKSLGGVQIKNIV